MLTSCIDSAPVSVCTGVQWKAYFLEYPPPRSATSQNPKSHFYGVQVGSKISARECTVANLALTLGWLVSDEAVNVITTAPEGAF